MLLGLHAMLFIVCTYRELYSTVISSTANFMKFVEVFGMFFNLVVMIQTIDCLAQLVKPDIHYMTPPCITDP